MLEQTTALLTVVGAILSLMYVIGSNPKLKARPLWRNFFILHHVTLIAFGFAALWLNASFLVYIALLWAVTMFFLTVWHWTLQNY